MKVLYGEAKEKFLRWATIIMVSLLGILFLTYCLGQGKNYNTPELYVKQSDKIEPIKCIEENYSNMAEMEKGVLGLPDTINEVWKYSKDKTLVLEPSYNIDLVFFAKPIGNVKESPDIIIEKIFAIESSQYGVHFDEPGLVHLNWIEVLNRATRTKKFNASINLNDNRVYIVLIKVNYKHIGSKYYSFKMVNPTRQVDIGDKYLENYNDTYIGDDIRIKQIINLLPYAEQITDIKIDNGNIHIKYSGTKYNPKYLEYNSVVLLSLIPLLDNINFDTGDSQITKNRMSYQGIDLKYENVKNIMLDKFGTIEGSNYEN
ncbi:MAG: DUF4825 domain-containing protein [Clostridia bacterium]|nr:DUF4825 domain-containing protein [Clostridia bacterium]